MWTYKGEAVTAIPEEFYGFVYLIKNTKTGKMYIGKKLFWFSKTSIKTVTLKSGVKKKKRIKSKVESDWKTYFGSSLELSSDIEKLGEDSFTREILHMCKNKSACSYLEAKEQMLREVLESDSYYNNNIMIRVHGSHIRGKL